MKRVFKFTALALALGLIVLPVASKGGTDSPSRAILNPGGGR